MQNLRRSIAGVAVALALGACSGMPMQKGRVSTTAWAASPRLGDSRTNARFAGANIPRLKLMLVDQICAASGGPCTYTGRDMASAHRGMNIIEGEFNALVGDLVRPRSAA